MSSDKDFIQPDAKKGIVVVKVNSSVFPIDLIYNASYLIMDRAYIILDGFPGEAIYAILRPRNFKGKLDELGRIFYDELIASAFHTVQFVRNKEVRDALINSLNEGCEPDEKINEEEVVKLWEEKFGETDERDNAKG